MWPCNVSGSDYCGIVFAQLRVSQHVDSQPVIEFHQDPPHVIGCSVSGSARALDNPPVPWLDALAASAETDRGIHNVANFQTARQYLQG